MKYWFKAKRYGWGWYPASWQGWLVLLAFLTVHITNWILNTDPLFLTLSTLFYVGVLLTICYRTGEPPRWRWGDDDSKKPSEK